MSDDYKDSDELDDDALTPIVGERIVDIQPMNMDDYFPYSGEGMNLASPVLILENGVRLYTSMDPEGNGPGRLFGVDPVGDPHDVENHFMVFLQEAEPDEGDVDDEAEADD